ncbi:sensor histidine kinase [Reichenbachiella versicolor]|uniref:sensor histidine kinase n=1 Tax=Reichenbachiella versicolor TaxID=1821036 RepID=UPI000D6E5BB3|nr:sensor histidine kinase [Reichenbachiella versicolor]
MSFSQHVLSSSCILFTLFFFNLQSIEARLVTFDSEDDLRFISSHVGLLDDSSSQMTVQDVSKISSSNWKRNKEGSKFFTNKYSNGNLWYRFDINNKTRETIWLRTESSGAWILDFYSPQSGGKYDKIELGRTRPDENKVFPADHYVVPIKPGNHTYYIMIQNKLPSNIMYVLGKTQDLSAFNQRQIEIPKYLFIGLMIAMLLYNVFALITIGDKLYIIYIAYLIGILFFVPFAMDAPIFSHIWFWDKLLVWANATYFLAGIFSINHLSLKKRTPRLYYLVMICMIILTVPYSILNYLDIVELGTLMKTWQVFLFVYIISMFVSGLVIWFKGYQNARFYVVGWVPLMLCLFIYITDLNGVLNLYILDGLSLYIGYGFEAILFTVALSDKINMLKKEKYDLIMAQNEMLESKVQTRTEELRKTNTAKDKLFAIIGHDLRSPVNSLKGLLGLIDQGLMTKEEFEILTSKLKDSVNHMYETLNNMLHWANSQMNGFDVKAKVVKAFDLAEENVRLTKSIASEKKITVTNEIEKDLTVECDPEHIKLVFRNLISNALKFTPDDGNIRIASKPSKKYIEFCVHDYGVGMTQEQVKNLFGDNKHKSENGTRGEKGTGLGLTLCKDFVEKNGGKIKAESEKGRGTSIFFTVPRAKS